MDDYRGLHALRIALSPAWPYEQFHIPVGGRLVYLSVASALTNLVFAVVGRGRSRRGADALAATRRGGSWAPRRF
jgi:hypothetical protein